MEKKNLMILSPNLHHLWFMREFQNFISFQNARQNGLTGLRFQGGNETVQHLPDICHRICTT